MKKNSQHRKIKKKKNKPKNQTSYRVDHYPSGPYEYPEGEIPLIRPSGFWNSLMNDISDVVKNKKNRNKTDLKDDNYLKSEEYNVCECCREQLKKENYVWDKDLMEYVALGEDGVPQKDSVLTEDQYGEMIEREANS
jgi:hypothetical protein